MLAVNIRWRLMRALEEETCHLNLGAFPPNLFIFLRRKRIPNKIGICISPPPSSSCEPKPSCLSSVWFISRLILPPSPCLSSLFWADSSANSSACGFAITPNSLQNCVTPAQHHPAATQSQRVISIDWHANSQHVSLCSVQRAPGSWQKKFVYKSLAGPELKYSVFFFTATTFVLMKKHKSQA